jgi:hypothetical protein
LIKYRVVDFDPQTIPENATVASEIEKILNANGANGWSFDRSEDLDDGQQRFYFSMSDEFEVAR